MLYRIRFEALCHRLDEDKMTNNLSITIAALLVLASSSPVIGFASLSSSRSCVQDFRSSSREVVSKQTCVFNRHEQQISAVPRRLTIQRMASDEEESETTEPEPSTADNSDDLAPSEATAGGGTIALTSAKSAADAATPPSETSSSKGFALILVPTLLFKFSIVLMVKFATDVVVYPTLYVWRWARVGKKKIGKGVAKLLGKEVEEKVNGLTTVVNNGESVGDFQ